VGLARAPSTLIHSFLTVGTILHPSCIWTYGLHMAVYAGVSGSVRLTPQNWSNQRQSRNTATNKHTIAPGAPSRACAVAVPRARTSANIVGRGNTATNKPITPVQQDPGMERKKIETKWPTGGRFLWTVSPYPPATSPHDSILHPGNSRLGDCPL
jgi:hypothetical protein